MSKHMRTVLVSLARQQERTAAGIGYAWVHRNTREALERRGLAVYLGQGRWGVTTLGLRAIGQ